MAGRASAPVAEIGAIAGYTVHVMVGGRIRLVTIALRHEAAVEKALANKYGEVAIVARTAIDGQALNSIGLNAGESLEWTPSKPQTAPRKG